MVASETELRPGTRVRCSDGRSGSVLIVRKANNAALVFLPALRTWRWVNTQKFKPTRSETA